MKYKDIIVEFDGFPGKLSLPTGWDSGQQTDMDRHLIYAVHQGQLQVDDGQLQQALQAGDLCWVPPQQSLHLRRAESGDRAVVSRCRLRLSPGGPTQMVVLQQAWAAMQTFSVLIEAAQQGQNYLLVHHAACLFLTQWHEAGRAQTGERVFSVAERQTLQTWLEHHRFPWPDVRDLASVMDMSHDYFSRVFKRSFGLSPKQWLVRERMQYAAAYLATHHTSLESIAFEFGYKDPRQFNRQFKMIHGLSPGRWRQQHRI